MENPTARLRRNLLLILLGVVILFQLLILINLMSIKLWLADHAPMSCGHDYDPCKVTVVPYR